MGRWALEVHTLYDVVSPTSGGKALESPVVAVHLLMPVLKLSVEVICQTPAVTPQSIQGPLAGKMGNC